MKCQFIISLFILCSSFAAYGQEDQQQEEQFQEDEAEQQQAATPAKDLNIARDRILLFDHRKPSKRPELVIYERIPSAEEVSSTPVLNTSMKDAVTRKPVKGPKAAKSKRGIKTKVKAKDVMMDREAIGEIEKEAKTADKLKNEILPEDESSQENQQNENSDEEPEE